MNRYQDIRDIFVSYFKRNSHVNLPSSSLIPHNDPSLLFVNSGMVQFKNNFLGLEKASNSRVVTVQKSLRAGGKHNDLDNVGYTARHHTLFEMLGNFSFGDYFKEQAIFYAWEFLTKEVGIDKNKLYITVYHTDDEAHSIWQKLTGFGDEKIIRIDTNDNFWSMGSTGPCGPCSEIYYDYGEGIKGGKPGTSDADGDRFVEIWNLVFMQFSQGEDGVISPLSTPCIDTGMGLERLVSVLEGKTDNYDTSLFRSLIENSREVYQDRNLQNNVAHRIVADHLRSSAFLIADGILPSNEGRGYVLRRIMRRAMRYLHQINPKKHAMHELFGCLEGLMSRQYSELSRYHDLIVNTLKAEEEGFAETLSRGLKVLSDALGGVDLSNATVRKSGILDGDTAFKLYDTYGFPLDMTQDILRRIGMELDVVGFEAKMSEQKLRSKGNWSGSGDVKESAVWLGLADQVQTEFVGYDHLKCAVKVMALVKDDNLSQVQEFQIGDELYIVFDKTPFYPLGGGQLGDIGTLELNEKVVAKVIDTQKYADGRIIASKISILEACDIKIGDSLIAEVDGETRRKRAANHSATHLLQAALRQALGTHVTQKGSFVSEDLLRFDFSHSKPMTQKEIHQVEVVVNQWIWSGITGCVTTMSKDEAQKAGAIANFGDKYGDFVRVVAFDSASVELCGGTHVENTCNIGIFKILSESSIASGVRRIEAITGQAALDCFQKIEQGILSCAKEANLSQDVIALSKGELVEKIKQLNAANKALEDENIRLEVENCVNQVALEVGEVHKGRLYFAKIADFDAKFIKDVTHRLSENIENDGILVLIFHGKAGAMAVYSKNSEVNAGKLIQHLTESIDGKRSGGGSPKFAMSGMRSDVDFNKILLTFKGYSFS